MKKYRVKKEWEEVAAHNRGDKISAANMDLKKPIRVLKRLDDELGECGNMNIRYTSVKSGMLIRGFIDEDMLEEW